MSDPGTLPHLIAWLATQPADQSFPASAGANCLYCQYGEAFDLGSTYDEVVPKLAIDPMTRGAIVSGHRTFGSALARAEALT